MAEPYNLTGLQNPDNLLELTQEANTIADGLLGVAILLTVFIVLFIAFKQYDMKKALAGSAFLCAVISIFLRLLSLIQDSVMFTMILIAAVSFVFLMWGGD